MANNLEVVDVVNFNDGAKNVVVHLKADQSKELLEFALRFLLAQGAIRLNELAGEQFNLEDIKPMGNA